MNSRDIPHHDHQLGNVLYLKMFLVRPSHCYLSTVAMYDIQVSPSIHLLSTTPI